MAKSAHLRLSDLRGFQRLAIDATLGLTDVVESLHHTIARTTGPLSAAPTGRTRGITGLVYRSVRGVTRLVGGGLDALLAALTPLVAEQPASEQHEAVNAALNGVLGDYLEATGNPLAIRMQMRSAGVALAMDKASIAAALPFASGKLVVLVHGLCMNDAQWLRDEHNREHDHGAALAQDLGYTPVYLHYNSGRHISVNGRELSELLTALLRAWPHPLERVAIVGHSMGGLVARSACHIAAQDGHAWLSQLSDLVFLGTPHGGAPLERAGAWVDYLLGISPYSAPFARLGKVRSAGIKDLRHGHLRDEDWQAPPSRSRVAPGAVPLPKGVRCYALAASLQKRAGSRLRGDGLVPVASALGLQRDAASSLVLPKSRRVVAFGAGHFDLLGRDAAYATLRGWLA